MQKSSAVFIVIAMAAIGMSASACHHSPTAPKENPKQPTTGLPDSSYIPPVQQVGSWDPKGPRYRVAPSITVMSTNPVGPTATMCFGNDSTRVFNIGSKQSTQYFSPSGCSSPPAFNPTNGSVGTAGLDGSKIVINATNGNTCVAQMPSNEARSAWDMAGMYLVVGGVNGSVNEFVMDCSLTRTLQTPTQANNTAISAVAVSQQNQIAFAMGAGPIMLSDTAGKNIVKLAELTGFTGSQLVQQMVFSPQGASLAVIRQNRTAISMFSTDSTFVGYKYGGLMVNMEAGYQPLASTFCAERRTLVAALNDGSGQTRLQVWDPMVPTSTGNGGRQTFEAHLMKEWHVDGVVKGLVCDTQGQTMTAFFADGTAQDYVPRLSNNRAIHQDPVLAAYAWGTAIPTRVTPATKVALY